MKIKMEQFPANNPNPVLSVAVDGTVLFSNDAGEPLLHKWGVRVGEKLPFYIGNFVQRVISCNNPEKMEVKVGNEVYLVVFHPLPEQECVNVSGFDISDQKELEGKLREVYENLQVQSEESQAQSAELKEANEALRESEECFYKAFYGNPAALTITRVADNRYVQVNDSYLHLFEYNREDVIGRSTKELNQFPNYAEREDVVALTLEQGYVHNYEMDVRTKTGRILRVLFSLETVNLNQERHILATLIDITERKQMEEALIEATRKAEHDRLVLESVIHQMPAGIIVTDASGEVAKNNEAMDKIWRREMLPTENIESHGYVAYHTDGREYQPEEWPLSRALLNGEEIIGEEMTILRGDGTKGTVHVSSVPVRDETGQIIAGIVVDVDITERKRTEEMLRLSEERFAKAFATNPAAIAMTRLEDGLIMEVNDTWLTMFGYSRDEVIGTLISMQLWPTLEDRARLAQELREKGFSCGREQTLLRRSGEPFTTLASAMILTIEGEEVILSTWLDIGDRKQAEEALQKAHDSLEEKVKERTAELEEAYQSFKKSEERFRIAVKNSKFVLSQFDLDLRYTWIYNPHSDFDATSLIGKCGDELEYSDEMRRFTALKRQVLESGKGIREELSFSRSDGVYTYDTIIEPLYNDTGDVIGGTTSALDITENKKAEEALAKIEIVRKQEIHHRIKNNLQVISSLLDLQAETFRDQEYIKDSEVLKAFRESQNRVISMALIHEELYKGRGFETLDFSPYIEKLAESLFQTYSIGNIDISLNMDLMENAFFDMDTAIPLGIIINELVSNSLKHAFTGRNKGEIRIKLHREESEDSKSTSYVLNISDDGIGIPEYLEIEDLDSLGMQLVTILVDQLDGELELKRNNGTEFAMRFAVIEKNNQASEPAPQQSI